MLIGLINKAFMISPLREWFIIVYKLTEGLGRLGFKLGFRHSNPSDKNVPVGHFRHVMSIIMNATANAFELLQ